MPGPAMKSYAKALAMVEECGISRGTMEDFDEFRDVLEAEGLEPKMPDNWTEGKPQKAE